ncbi:MAG: COG3014 family protein [Bdellovibrionales bacterium]
MKKLFLSLSILLFVIGCSTYQKKSGEARGLLERGRPDEAIKILEPLAKEEGDDQLVYLLDYAVALQSAGRYEDSTKAFLQAAKLAEVKDYHSLSRVVGSFALNEGMIQYKGEDYEKLLINVFLAQNFLMQNDLDGALVETRRLDQMLNKYRIEAKRDYEQNAFAVYLSAMIWEADRKWDDAYIAYSRAHKLRPDIKMLGADLLRSSQMAQRPEEFDKWKKLYPKVKMDKKWWKDPNMGELVLVYQQGRAAVKRPHPDMHRIPKLFHVPSNTAAARLEVIGGPTQDTEIVYNVSQIAIKTLDDAYTALIAKRVAGLAAKAVIADQVRQKDELLGFITWIGLNIADQADLRQWSTLPETFQVARIPLAAGTYKMKIHGLLASGTPSGEAAGEQEIKIEPRKKKFLLWRSFQ